MMPRASEGRPIGRWPQRDPVAGLAPILVRRAHFEVMEVGMQFTMMAFCRAS
jgi:hypothetical protein